METWQKKHIKSKLETLVEYTSLCPLLCAELTTHGVLTDSDKQTLKAIKRSQGKEAQIAEFYNILIGKANSFDILSRCLESLEQTGAVKELQEIPQKIWFNVTNPTTNFYGRHRELENLQDFIYRKNSDNVYDYVTCIVGMGGIGKTELCRQFCYNNLKHTMYMDVVWINGETDLSITESFTKLAEQLGLPTKTMAGEQRDTKIIAHDIFTHLKSYDITFVFDNVENFEILKAGGYLSSAYKIMNRKPYFLVTSRYTKWNDDLGVQCTFQLDKMDFDDAVNWILSSLPKTPENRKTAEELADKLDCYTLALQQAISYIIHRNETSNYTVANYIEDFTVMEIKIEMIASRCFMSQSNTYNYTTFTTFKTSIRYIEEKECGTFAIKMLYKCAYLSPDDIPSVLFFTQAKSEEVAVKKAFALLTKFSLLKINSAKNYAIHRILQDVLRCYLSIEDTKSPCFDESKENLEITYPATEVTLLEEIIVRLNSSCTDEIRHAVCVWTFAPYHQQLVKSFYPRSEYGRFKMTPLHLLSEEGNLKAVQLLIHALQKSFSHHKCKLLVNKIDKCSRTSAFLAAASGHPRIIEELYNVKANFRIPSSICYVSFEKLNTLYTYDNSCFTAMHIAAYNNHVYAVQMLDKLDPELAAITAINSETAASIAAKFGNMQLLKALSNHSIADEIGCIVTSIANGSIQIEDLGSFLKKKNLSSLPSEANSSNLTGCCWSLIQLAIWVNAPISVLNLLVSKGAKLDKFPDLYNKAACNNNPELFKWLIEQNLKINDSVDIYLNWTPLYEAAKAGALDIVKFICPERGSNGVPGLDISINVQDKKGDTPLYQAAYHGQMNVIEYLINNGANVNLYNKWGSTPIAAAAIQSKFDVVMYLARHPDIILQPSKIDKEKFTLLSMLNLHAVHATVAYDLVDETEALLNIYKERDDKLFSKLFYGGCDDGGETISLLHAAAFFDSPKVIRYLLTKYSEHIRVRITMNIYDFVNGFYLATRRKAFHIPKRASIATCMMLRLMSWYRKETFDVTPFALARFLDHEKSALELEIQEEPKIHFLAKWILAMLMKKVKFYQHAMKQYLNVQSEDKFQVGIEVTDFVNKAILGGNSQI